MKIISHPGHGNSKCCIVGKSLDLFQFLEDVSPLIQEASSVLTGSRGASDRGQVRHNTERPTLQVKTLLSTYI